MGYFSSDRVDTLRVRGGHTSSRTHFDYILTTLLDYILTTCDNPPMTDPTTPADPSQIVTYFREMLARSEKMEVQILVSSAGCYDPERNRFDVHVGIGALEGVQSLPPAERRAALGAVLRGLQAAVDEVEKVMQVEGALLQ